MSRLRAVAAGVAATVLLGLLSAPVSAVTAGRPTGVVISPSSSVGLDVTLDVTMNTTGTSPIGTIGSPVGFAGALWSFQYTFFGTTVTNRYVWQSPYDFEAVDFGDTTGTVTNTVLPLAAAGPPNSYAGSFMHSYPGPGTYTATTSTNRFIGFTSTVPAPTAGTFLSAGTATTIMFQVYYLPTFTTPFDVTANFVAPFVYGIRGSTDVTLGPFFDRGDHDAPYPTLDADGGPSHELGSGTFLGACADSEDDGQPTAGSDGDDTAIGPVVDGACGVPGDDEDGVVFTTPLVAGTSAGVDVTASAACTLSAWVDFDGNGDWSGPGEELFPGGTGLAPGANPLVFAVPATATAGTTAARFRCTTDGPVAPTGPASDGEVEDHPVDVTVALDFGDAGGTYPTLLGSDGARHELRDQPRLGVCADGETDGLPAAGADGDDLGGGMPEFGTCVSPGDDEDGVSFPGPVYVGATADLEVVATAPCTLSAWIDFDQNGDWADVPDDIVPGGASLVAGPNAFTFDVPFSAAGGTTTGRFRCTTDGAVGPTGSAGDGEVEDHALDILVGVDFGDGPAPYPTLLADDGPRHDLVGGVFLGDCADGEPDGQPSALADADETTDGVPIVGTCDPGAEEGVSFGPLRTGQIGEVEVEVSASCTLSGWIDFDQDGDWSDPGEELFPGGALLASGSNVVPFPVPSDAAFGETLARLRCTTQGPVGFTGPAVDGEVEDLVVEVVPDAIQIPTLDSIGAVVLLAFLLVGAISALRRRREV